MTNSTIEYLKNQIKTCEENLGMLKTSREYIVSAISEAESAKTGTVSASDILFNAFNIGGKSPSKVELETAKDDFASLKKSLEDELNQVDAEIRTNEQKISEYKSQLAAEYRKLSLSGANGSSKSNESDKEQSSSGVSTTYGSRYSGSTNGSRY